MKMFNTNLPQKNDDIRMNDFKNIDLRINEMQTESLRILKLFSDQYNGKPWTEVRLIDILNGISAQIAAEKPISNANNIWQLVQHITAWRENVLSNLKGETLQTPADNYHHQSI